MVLEACLAPGGPELPEDLTISMKNLMESLGKTSTPGLSVPRLHFQLEASRWDNPVWWKFWHDNGEFELRHGGFVRAVAGGVYTGVNIYQFFQNFGLRFGPQFGAAAALGLLNPLPNYLGAI